MKHPKSKRRKIMPHELEGAKDLLRVVGSGDMLPPTIMRAAPRESVRTMELEAGIPVRSDRDGLRPAT